LERGKCALRSENENILRKLEKVKMTSILEQRE
jgi:hypothetical protein